MVASAINQVTHPCALEWSGLGVAVANAPRPPPTCPTMTMEVGMVFAVAPVVVGVNDRLFVRLMVKLVAVPAAARGTVMTTGDQVEVVTPFVVVTDEGLSGPQVAVEPVAAVPQK